MNFWDGFCNCVMCEGLWEVLVWFMIEDLKVVVCVDFKN